MTMLVTGATGKVGRRVIENLTQRGVSVRAGSRRSPVPLDWNDSATWPAVLEGVDRVFLVVPGGDDGHRSVTGLGPRVCDFLDLAASTGLSRVVLMTALGMDFAPAEVEQRAVELHLQASALAWTILRPNWFFQNFTEGPLRDVADAHDGVLRLPTGGGAVSFIDARDIAAAASEALTGGHGDREYALTGPESLTFADVAATLSAFPTIPIGEYEATSDEEFRRSATDLGWHRDYIATLSTLFATIVDGAAAGVSDDAEHILGRSPRTLREFIATVDA